ncbi:MAG: hypothetical protein WAK76_01845 [Trebonia sp.]
MIPFTVDGLIYASSMVMLDAARRKVPVPALARWLLGVGIAANIAANIAHGLGHGRAGAAVAAWPAVALVGSCELLMIIRGARVPAGVTAGAGLSGRPPAADPLLVQAAQLFADDLAAGPFRRCALSARGFMSDSRVRSEHRRTWPASPPDSRPERRSNIHDKWVPGNDKIVQDPPYPRGQWSAGASQLRRGAARAVTFRPRLAR